MKHTAPTFFDLENQFAKIYQINNFLLKLKQIIPWEIFRPTLEQIRNKERLSNAGRKPLDVILMFKIIVLQTVYKLSIEQTELQIRDFLDLAFADTVPDAKTIWLFAEQLKKQGIEQQLFDRFNAELEERGFGINSGLIVDSTFVEVPKQHNTHEENAAKSRSVLPNIRKWLLIKIQTQLIPIRTMRSIIVAKTMYQSTTSTSSFAVTV